MTRETFPLIVTAFKDIAPQVRQLSLQKPHGEPFSYIPGQFISIHFSLKGEELRRSYSIASLPHEPTLDIALSYFKGGAGSEYIFNLAVGDTVTASGPYGRLILQDHIPQRYILMATGTGVTPYRAMLPTLSNRLRDNPTLRVSLMFGIRDPEYALYREDFVNFAAAHPRFHLHFHYSRVGNASLKPYEYTGYVQEALPHLQLSPEQDIVYLCGNPSMIDDAFAWLKTHGFQPQQVKREKYIS